MHKSKKYNYISELYDFVKVDRELYDNFLFYNVFNKIGCVLKSAK